MGRCISLVASSESLVASLRWGLQDSNLCRHSQRIYSPPPLTTRANPQKSLQSFIRCLVSASGNVAGRCASYRCLSICLSGSKRNKSPVRKPRQLLRKKSPVSCVSRFGNVRRNQRANGGIRTHDRLITNQLLCQLSYVGRCCRPGRAECTDPQIRNKTELMQKKPQETKKLFRRAHAAGLGTA